jgi:hypothetical protein
LTDVFDVIHILSPDHASIVGFKHNLHEYLVFERNLFLDSDIIWCKDPDPLWKSMAPHEFTITGTQVSDNFFGGPKNIGVLADIFMRRRRRTLRRFGLTYLCRVQTGMIYAREHSTTKKVCTLAQEMLDRKDETHFRSRTLEHGRSEESCEWSLAMAMAKMDVPVYPWFQGHTSPQLDYVSDFTSHDPDFEYVVCRYYCDEFVYNLRGLENTFIRKLLIKFFSQIPGKGDYLETTPYCLHFGWYHQKQPFFKFAEKTWHQLTNGKQDLLSSVNRLEGTHY